MDDRLASRFGWGLTATNAGAGNACKGILLRKAEQENINSMTTFAFHRPLHSQPMRELKAQMKRCCIFTLHRQPDHAHWMR